MSELTERLAAAKAASATTTTTTPEKKEAPNTQEKAPAESVVERTFNRYKATMQSFKMVRPDGKVIHILKGELITDNEADIKYIDAEIKDGFPYLRAAEQVTSTELDPMASLRAQMKEEARKELLAERVAELADMGETDKQGLKPASTVDLGALGAGSNSAATE